MHRKENRNPNAHQGQHLQRKQPVKAIASHSTTPDCSSRPNYVPRFIKKDVASIKQELHSETYLNSPNSLMQSVMGMEPFKKREPEANQELELERELRERTKKFNASILSFQQILIGINQVICDETIPDRVRLTNANDRISDLLNVFQEFSLNE
jgi:uncharacterized protein (UPF0147 family)